MAKLFELAIPYRLKVQESAMKIGLEHIVIIALVILLIVFILANMNKFSAGEQFIQNTQNDLSEEAGAWSQ